MDKAGTGVFYRPEDYASVLRRLAIDAADSVAVAVLGVLLWIIIAALSPDLYIASAALYVGITPLLFAYFVLLKRSRFRTLGYNLCGTRIVNLQGTQPGIFSLVLRLFFALGGPLNFVIDLIWISGDPMRQALRDKFAHTYVIRKDATPAGTGQIVFRTYTVLGGTMIFQEVDTATSAVER